MKLRQILVSTILALGLAITVNAIADEKPILNKVARTPTASSATEFDWARVAVSVIALKQSGYSLVSGDVAWQPSYSLCPEFALQAELGAGLLKDGTSGKLFVAPELVLFASYRPGKFSFEAGPGAQVWVAHGGTFATANARLVGAFPKKWYADRWFLQYQAGFVSSGTVHELRVGLGFTL